MFEFLTSASLGLFVFLIGLIAIRSVFPRRKNRHLHQNLPPSGPREWPIIGCMLSLVGDEPYKIFARMGKEYGPVFRTHIGTTPTVVLNDFKSIREAFARSGDDFADRPTTGIMEVASKGKGIVCAHVGEAHREKRHFALSALRSLGMGKSRLVENIVSEIEDLSAVFVQHHGKPFFPFRDITVSVSNIINWIVFGKRFRHDDARFQGLLATLRSSVELCAATGIAGFIPILTKLPLPVWRKLDANSHTLTGFLNSLIKEVLDNKDSRGECFVQLYNDELKRREQVDSSSEVLTTPDERSNGMDDYISSSGSDETFNENDRLRIIGDLFGAGTDTTATTLHWAIVYLILYPDVQRKIHAELDRAIGAERMPTLSDRKAIPYTEAVLLEIQRAATIVPFGAPHAATSDAKLFDFDIPAGTLIMPNIWAVHHDPQVWTNPDEFMPERFLNDEGGPGEQRDELMPFSIGRRKCLGEELAKMELFFFFTHLVHRFEFRLPEGAPRPSTSGSVGATRNPEPFEVCAILRHPTN